MKILEYTFLACMQPMQEMLYARYEAATSLMGYIECHYFYKKAYRRRKDFHYPYAQLLINGWYVGNWWEGSPEEQQMLELKYGCSVEQRKSLVPFILGPQQSTGNVVPNDSIISDYGYVSMDITSVVVISHFKHLIDTFVSLWKVEYI